MLTIYHNNRCSKSREGVCFLENLNQPFEIVNYLETPFDFNKLSQLINTLNIKPIELVRVKEKDWIENFKGKQLTDVQIIQAMVDFPKLIERPIVVNGNKAVIARPVERINEIR
ncbi:MAG: arsenate reductase (glutaredoxin) [Flavobacterium sp.]